jgi:hypothetical protein
MRNILPILSPQLGWSLIRICRRKSCLYYHAWSNFTVFSGLSAAQVPPAGFYGTIQRVCNVVRVQGSWSWFLLFLNIIHGYWTEPPTHRYTEYHSHHPFGPFRLCLLIMSRASFPAWLMIPWIFCCSDIYSKERFTVSLLMTRLMELFAHCSVECTLIIGLLRSQKGTFCAAVCRISSAPL